MAVIRSVVVSALAAVIIVCTNANTAFGQVDSWAQTNVGGASAPSPRNGHAFVAGDGQYAYLFGGSNGPPSPAELWRYDHLSATWTLLPATGPAKRKFAASSFGAGNFILFGGASGIGLNPYYNDTWSYSESAGRWSSGLKCGGGHPCPAPRMGAAMAYDRARNSHVLFGGVDGSGVAFGDTWIYQASTRRWTQAPIPGGASPTGRAHQAMTYVGPLSEVVMFGGVTSNGGSALLADLWGWDGARWNAIVQNNTGPSLSAMGMVYDGARAKLVVFGGSTSPVSNVLTADTWTFEFSTGLWTNLGPTTGLDPRNASPMAYLPKYGVRLFACGLSDGINGRMNVNDTWEGR